MHQNTGGKCTHCTHVIQACICIAIVIHEKIIEQNHSSQYTVNQASQLYKISHKLTSHEATIQSRCMYIFLQTFNVVILVLVLGDLE